MKKMLLAVLLLMMISGCAYQSYNSLNVKAKKFRYGLLISCENCSVDMYRSTGKMNVGK